MAENKTKTFAGAFANENFKEYNIQNPGKTPVFTGDLEKVLDELNIKDGSVLSFHHHLRNGDFVLGTVMKSLQKRGVKNITIAASSIFPVHECLVDMFADETVTKIVTSYMSGPVAEAVSAGKCKDICVMTTHGGRPRSILEGELVIDAAFVAAPAVDRGGSASGTGGKSSCGVLGYAVADAQMAQKVVILTDYIADTLVKKEIDGGFVDYVVTMEAIGDPKGIVSGTTVITKDPVGLRIAKNTAGLIDEIGVIKDGFSFQTGAGGISLAVAAEVRELMKSKNVKGSFASGGITDYMVEMLEEGLFESLMDVQCFNLGAVESIERNEKHIKMSANDYANINNRDNCVNKLDVVILGATEVDLEFNVNVTTGSDGKIMGGSGGHADTAAGAKFSIIVSKLVSSRMSVVVDRVTTITTPGETVDILVTDRGIAINPKHAELIERLQKESTFEIRTIQELKAIAEKLTGVPEKTVKSETPVAVSQYRDGTVIDVIYKV